MTIKRTLALVSLLGMLIACQPTDDETPAIPTSESQLNASNEFIVWGTSPLTEDLDAYLEATFEEQHPDIDVVFVDAGWDEALRANFDNAIQMGRPPDIIIGENYFRNYAAQDQLLSVDSVIAQYDDILEGSFSAGIYEDSTYAIPYFTGTFALERNCAVVEQAGLSCETVPATWADLLDEAQAITNAGLNDYYGFSLQGPGEFAVGSAFRIAVFQAQLNALPCADDACTIPDFNRPDGLPVLEFLRQLHNYTPPGLSANPIESDIYEALFRGVSAYQVGASWHPTWAQDTGCDNCSYHHVPLPENGEPANMLVGNVLFAAPANAPNPDLALEWLSLLLSDDVQSRIYDMTGRLPVRTNVLTELQATVDEDAGAFVEELLTAQLYILPQWEENPRETWQIYNMLLSDVLYTDRPIPDLMAEAQSAVEALP